MERPSELGLVGEWEVLDHSAHGPSARCGHTVTMHGDYHTSDMTTMLVTFGESSLSADRKFLNDMYLLDLESRHWIQVLGDRNSDNVLADGTELCEYVKCSMAKPMPRADHSSCAFGRRLDNALIFGGKCNDTYLDDLILVRHIPSAILKSTLRKMKPSVTDFCRRESADILRETMSKKPMKIESLYLSHGPVGRRGCSLTSFDTGLFLLFGGQRGSLFLDDLWKLDLNKGGWMRLDIRGEIPSPRAYHTAFVDDEAKYFVLGGVKDGGATPAEPDIFAFEYRENRFIRLGGKDIAPGLEVALVKGHHGSHFIRKAKDLVIYSPQNGHAFVLGGNKRMDHHCGKCVPINLFRSSERHPPPRGTCRPATALLPSAVCPPGLYARGCRDELLERLIVYGGYLPHNNTCTTQLRSLQFSTLPCRIRGDAHPKHQFEYTPTDPVLKENIQVTINLRTQLKEQRQMEAEATSAVLAAAMLPLAADSVMSDKTLLLGASALRELSASSSSLCSSPLSLSMTPSSPTAASSCSSVGERERSHRLSNITPMRPVQKKPVVAASMRKCMSATPSGPTRRVTLTRTPVRKRLAQRGTQRSSLSHTVSDTSMRKLESFDPKLFERTMDEEWFWDLSVGMALPSHVPTHIRVIQEILVKRTQSLSKLMSAPTIASSTTASSAFPLLDDCGDMSLPFMLSATEFRELVCETQKIISKEPTLLKIEPAVKIFGDIHGQLSDLMALFDSFGLPSRKTGDLSVYKYIFLGDFVDRGKQSLEVIALLMSLKIQFPDRVYLVRGNHECRTMNELYGFYDEIERRIVDMEENDILSQQFGDFTELSSSDTALIREMKKRVLKEKMELAQTLKDEVNTFFMWLPLAALIGERILCVHGGIGQVPSIEKIANLHRPCEVQAEIGNCSFNSDSGASEEQDILIDVLWSDPAETDQECGFQSNSRGVSCVFGSDVVHEFCHNNDIDLIVRAHQVVIDGFEYFAAGHLITVFSATNYCSQMDNAGAILCVDDAMRVVPKLVEPRTDDDNPSVWVQPESGAPPSPMRGAVAVEGEEDDDEMDVKAADISDVFKTETATICDGRREAEHFEDYISSDFTF